MRRLLLILTMLFSAITTWATCGVGYTYVRPLTIWHSNFASTLTNFPLLMCFNGACTSSTTLTDLKTVGNGGKIQNTVANSIGTTGPADLQFCTSVSGGTAIKYEVAAYSATTGATEIWLQDASASSTTDQIIYMFYGNSSVVTTQQDLSLWSDANYSFVSHYPNGSTLGVKDSSGNTSPTNNSATASTGQIDGSVSFASTQSIDVNSPVQVTADHTMSVTAWFKPGLACGGSGGFQGIAADALSSGNGWYLYWCIANTTHFAFKNAGSASNMGGERQSNTGPTSPAGSYSFIAGTWDGTTGQGGVHTYWNGALADGVTGTNGAGTAGTNMTIAKWVVTGTNPYIGGLDELRVASDAKSANWLAAEYANDSTPANSYNIGPIIDARTPAGLASGGNCIPVVIDHTKVPNTDQTNFQFTVGGVYPWMRDVANSGYVNTAAGQNNIVWYSNSTCTTVIPFEIESWINTTGQFQSWVQVATASHTVDTTVYLGIGKPSNTTDQSNKTSLWGSNHVIDTYHFGTPVTLGKVGSGSAALDLSVGQSGTPQASLGVTGGGGAASIDNQTFPGTWLEWVPSGSDTIGAHGFPTGSAVSTLSAWVRLYTTNTNLLGNHDMMGYAWGKTNLGGGLGGRDLTFENDQADGHHFANIVGVSTGRWFDNNPGVGACTDIGGGSMCSFYGSGNTTPAAVIDTNWHYYTWVYGTAAGALSTSTMYVDGTAVTSTFYGYPNGSASVPATGNADGTSGAPAKVTVGDGAGHDCCRLVGQVDEARTLDVAVTADRVATDYNNQSSPLTFYSFGTSAPVVSGGVRHRVTNQ
jgi:hypothetical protein